MRKYNIALVPSDRSYSEQLISAAQASFKSTSKGYLLGKQAIPHITICQFMAEDDLHAVHVAQNAPPHILLGRDVQPDMIYFRPQKKVGDDFYNAGILIVKTSELESLQQELFAHIALNDVRPLTKSGSDYWPHLTMAYTNKTSVLHADFNDWAFSSVSTRVVLAHSDENGQMQRIIWDAPKPN